MFIDIHNHTLFGVDDGPKRIDESIAMLENAYQQGIRYIILTPHYRLGMFETSMDLIQKNYILLREKAEDIGVELYLGCEYHVDSQIMDNLSSGRCKGLGDTDYILTEYSYKSGFSYIEKTARDLLSCGYIPIIAHAERYACFADKPELVGELSAMGALIQINANSILGIDGSTMKKCTKKLLKKSLVDIVASDTHSTTGRTNNLAECFDYVSKKYGMYYAEKIFFDNPNRIIDEIKRVD
ncbi:MAG: CpsB/CapC family capsule biosynthesis tyrosine phosphatase [Wujia sp.]